MVLQQPRLPYWPVWTQLGLLFLTWEVKPSKSFYAAQVQQCPSVRVLRRHFLVCQEGPPVVELLAPGTRGVGVKSNQVPTWASSY